jgi:hypothetical protein
MEENVNGEVMHGHVRESRRWYSEPSPKKMRVGIGDVIVVKTGLWI